MCIARRSEHHLGLNLSILAPKFMLFNTTIYLSPLDTLMSIYYMHSTLPLAKVI